MRIGPTRIEICGGIASGKTTLAKLLQNRGVVPIYENFRANPFYEAFYRDPIGTAFETEITFLLQHYHQQKHTLVCEDQFCFDFSPVLDHAYACVTLPKAQLRLFRGVLHHVEAALPPRALLVHLVCRPEIELMRIRRRHRRAERQITVDYLEKLSRALDTRVMALPRSSNLLAIDSGTTDFAHNRRDKSEVLRRITDALKGR